MLLVRVIAALSMLIIGVVASTPFWTDTKDISIVSSADIEAMTKNGAAVVANVSANFSDTISGGAAIASALTSTFPDGRDAPMPDEAYSTLRPMAVASLVAPRRAGDFEICDPPASPRGVRSIYLFQSAPTSADADAVLSDAVLSGGASGAPTFPDSPQEVEILIEGSDPVYLVLASEAPTLWRFSGAVGSAVGVVIVEAAAGGSEVLGLARSVVSGLDQDCARAPGEGEMPDDGLAWDETFDEAYERSSTALIAFPGVVEQK